MTKINKHQKFFAYIIKSIAGLLCLYGFLMLIENILPYSQNEKPIESLFGQQKEGGHPMTGTSKVYYYITINGSSINTNNDFWINVKIGDTLLLGNSLFLNKVKRMTLKNNTNITYSTIEWWDILIGLLLLSNIIILITSAEDLDKSSLIWLIVNIIAVIVWSF